VLPSTDAARNCQRASDAEYSVGKRIKNFQLEKENEKKKKERNKEKEINKAAKPFIGQTLSFIVRKGSNELSLDCLWFYQNSFFLHNLHVGAVFPFQLQLKIN